jgi:hypothetical protein
VPGDKIEGGVVLSRGEESVFFSLEPGLENGSNHAVECVKICLVEEGNSVNYWVCA